MIKEEMTKDELIKAPEQHLAPGESVTVTGKALESLTDSELISIYTHHAGGPRESVRAVVMADRQREFERMRESWGWRPLNLHIVARFLGVEFEL